MVIIITNKGKYRSTEGGSSENDCKACDAKPGF